MTHIVKAYMDNELKYQKDLSYKDSPECQQILQWVGSQKRVLEVGCHTADLGVVLKEYGNYVVGIDYNEKAISVAKTKIQEAYVLNLETEKQFFATTEKFDIVVCNQVLEHLHNSEEVLQELYNALKPNGTIIIGLPNIANAKDRFNVTWGQWRYTDIGVMDKTHVHFFTYGTAVELITNAKLRIEDYQSFWQVNPIWEFFDHIPILCKFCKLLDEHKPSKRFSHNITDVVMLFKCIRK